MNTVLDNDLADWSNKSQNSKGGTVLHTIRYGDIKKACGHMLGTKCSCKPILKEKKNV